MNDLPAPTPERSDTSSLFQGDRLNRILAESLQDIIFIIDRDDRVAYVNPTAAGFLRLPPGEILGKPRSSFFSGIDGERQKQALADVFKSGEVLHTDSSISAPDMLRWINTILIPIKDDAGRVEAVMGVSRDITDRKIAEDALRDSEMRHRFMAENSSDMITRQAADGTFLYLSPACHLLLGYEPEELIGTPAIVIIHPDDAEAVLKRLQLYLSTSGKMISDCFRVRRKDGTYIWWESTLRSVFDPNTGAVQQLVGVGRDITDRKRAEDALAAEKERLSVTLSSIGDGVIVTNREGRIEFMNRVAEQLTGRLFEESWGRQLDEVWHAFIEPNREPCTQLLAKIIETGEGVNPTGNIIIQSRHGTERLVSLTAAPLKDSANNISGMVLAFNDITEKSRMEEEVRKSRHLESLGILAGGIAHDFNNLLAGIFGYMDVAVEAIHDPARAHDYLQKAMGVLQRAKDLTQQLLTFAKGGSPLRKLTSVAELIKDTSAFAMAGSNIKLLLSLPDDLESCELDVGQISEVINNLLINAQQAMPNGGTISISAENLAIEAGHNLSIKNGRYVRIKIRDTGIGIPANYLDRIFDPFFTTKQKGSGLGLTISYSVIKKHEGCLRVESELGKGTEFQIYLPASPHKATEKVTAKPRPKSGHGKVLIMDDEEVLRDVGTSMLKALGYTPFTVSTGTEAVNLYAAELAKNAPFACIILDLTVPGEMGGKQAMQKIIELDPNARGIVSSGYSDDAILSNPHQFGFRAILRKPFTLRDLGNVIHQALS